MPGVLTTVVLSVGLLVLRGLWIRAVPLTGLFESLIVLTVIGVVVAGMTRHKFASTDRPASGGCGACFVERPRRTASAPRDAPRHRNEPRNHNRLTIATHVSWR